MPQNGQNSLKIDIFSIKGAKGIEYRGMDPARNVRAVNVIRD